MELLFHPVSQPSRAVQWFIKNHDLKVSFKVVDIMKGEASTAEFKAINPFESVPVLKLEDGSYLAESSAILNYLATKFGVESEYPTKDLLAVARIHEAQLRHDSLSRLVTTKALRPLLARLHNPQITRDELRVLVASNLGSLEWALQTLDAALGQQKFIAGNTLTVADYNVISELNQLPLLEPVLPESVKVSKFANIARYLEDAKALPNYDSSVAAIGGVFAALTA